MSPDPIVNAIENYGGSATISQISSATSIKRDALFSLLTNLSSSGTVERVGGGVWRIKPKAPKAKVVKPKAKIEKPKASKVAVKKAPAPNKRSSPVSSAVLATITSLGGVAKVKQIADLTGFASGSVSDSCYKLKKEGRLVMPSNGVYALSSMTPPAAPQRPSKPAPAPKAPEPVSEAPATPEVKSPEVDPTGLIVQAMSLLVPGGKVPLSVEGLYAAAEFMEAAEHLVKVTHT